MDIFSHRIYIESQRTKGDEQIAISLMRAWKAIGIPKYLQLDNESSFHGSNNYPRSFGVVIKLCLHFGIQPVFIPAGEPWRNGVIEKFNDTYNRKFFRRQCFANYLHLKRESKRFQRFHNACHRYSCLKGKSPDEFIGGHDYKPEKLPPNTKLPKFDSIPGGKVVLIRFIRSNRKLDIFGEKFRVSESLVYSYVKAEIDTRLHILTVYSGDESPVEIFEYKLPG